MLIFTLISLGFFGGFSHCTLMCSPFVITQLEHRLEKISLEKFSQFERLKNFALLPYHLGRITTYSLIGFLCSLLAKTLEDFSGFRFVSATLLLIASLFFFAKFFEKTLRFKRSFLEGAAGFFPTKISKKISVLFQNPRGLRGYFLGIILGFIPCGLLYGAFLVAAAISNPFLAAMGMIFFGIATFPALFLSGCAGHFLLKFSEIKKLSKIVILINAIMLALMSFRQVN